MKCPNFRFQQEMTWGFHFPDPSLNLPYERIKFAAVWLKGHIQEEAADFIN